MTVQVGRCTRGVLIAFLLGACSGVSSGQSQSFAGKTPEGKAVFSYGAPTAPTGEDIIAKMLERNRMRSERLQRYSAVRIYELRNLQGKLAAQTVVRVDYEAPDKKTFDKTSETGSGIVRHLVFDRLMQSEAKHLPAGSITTARSLRLTTHSRWSARRTSARTVASFSTPRRNAKINI